MNPLLVKWAAGLALLIAAFVGGVKVESDHRDAQQLVQERAAASAFRAGVDRSFAIGKKLGGKKRAIEKIFVPIEGAVAGTAATACLSDDQLRFVNKALGAASAGGGDGAVREADPAGGG